MKPYAKWVAASLLAASSIAVAQTTPQDVPPGHWAYEAVQELAGKGLILGYPDGKFLGNRALTRYEMAAITQRLLRRLEEMIDQKTANATPATPPAGVSPEDLAEVRRLVDEYKVELTVMGTDLQQVKTQIAELQGLKDTVEGVQSNLEGVMDAQKLDEANIAGLQKLKISGYIQSRYQTGQGAPPVATTGNDRFLIRRSRIKITYAGDKADFVWQPDIGANNNATGRDIYIAQYLGKPTDKQTQNQIWFGQFNVPFGFEIERSDSQNEFSERSMAEQVLFPGERDRGIRAVWGLGPRLTVDASVLNGGGLNDANTEDNFKTGTARAKYAVSDKWDVGVSGYFGHQEGLTGAIAAKPATSPVTTFVDSNGNGIADLPGELKVTPGSAAVAAVAGNPFKTKRTRIGADTQLYILGGVIRAEGFWGRQPVNNPTSNPVPSVLDVPVQGWYASYVRDITKQHQLGVRYDEFNANRDVDGQRTTRINAVWNYFLGSNMRYSLSYEWFPKVPTGAVKDHRLFFQAQHSF